MGPNSVPYEPLPDPMVLMAQAKLEVTDQLGRRIVQIETDPFAIGRRDTSDLHLPSAGVSRDHAEIASTGDGFEIRDRGSRYGTFVNGEEVKAHRLKHGDRVQLGRGSDVELVFLLSDASAEDSHSASAIGEMRQVAVLLKGLRALGSGKVLDDVLALVMDSAISVGGAERGFVMLANDAGELEFKLGRSQKQTTLPGGGFKTSLKIPREVFRTGRPRIEADLLEGDLAGQHEGTVALGIRHVLCMPLQLTRYLESSESGQSEQRRVGVFYLDSRRKGTLMSPATRATMETLAAEAAVAIDNAQLYKSAIEKAKLDQEMATAAQIQQSLMPTRSRAGKFFDLAAEMIACRSIGGDFFEFVDLPDGRFGFALGDVSGKGPAAALLAALAQGHLGAQTNSAQGPAATLASLNEAIANREVDGKYATMFYGLLDPQGHLIFCNGGHNPPFLVGTNGTRRLETGGMPVGMFPGAQYEEETLTMEPGDFLVVFSDGVSEALNADEEEFEDARILESIEGSSGRDAQTQLEHLFSSVKAFTAGADQYDDVTVLVVSYRGIANT